ncbi:hypothetical protein H5J25_02270 [Sphingomonas aliaeris]|uniref:Uncharacterized protein n=1 Tax=Sphingomonas aliaeris TaxID=2759526 RepID=A0A974NVN4_9SPHN|nr:hypothetical protein [Sphingomonas aliaeris]QQV77648.1 hypothetical protein H5J25_02270 [Sphingomonas aliaeris]
MADTLESILLVYQNPVEGRLFEFDDWYTNIHIRDAMRLDSALATQRFCIGEEQPVLDGKATAPALWAHTIYEWNSARRSVDGHLEYACTPRMEISRDGDFTGLRDYFYKPEYLSHGWTREAGFRRGSEILTALIQPKSDFATFRKWFEEVHAPDTLAMPGFGSASLFSLHEVQHLPSTTEFPVVAIYGMTDRSPALKAWAQRHDSQSSCDLSAQVEKLEIGAWQSRIERLRVEDVIDPTPEAAARESKAREAYAGTYLSKDELDRALSTV